MPNFTKEEFEFLLKKTDNLRNVCVFGSTGHGIETFLDSIILLCGAVVMEHYHRMGDVQQHHSEDPSILRWGKIPSFSCYFELEDKKHMMVNMSNRVPLESGGREIQSIVTQYDQKIEEEVEFTEFRDMIRNFDGAIGIVDGVSGVNGEFKDCLYEIISKNRMESVLMINKLDKYFTHEKKNNNLEQVYQNLVSIIYHTNHEINTFSLGQTTKEYFDPVEKNNIVFGSSLDNWGFTIETFASLYAKKFGVSKEKLVTKFWGDRYFHPKKKKWTKKSFYVNEKGKKIELKRSFCQFCLKPISVIYEVCINDNPTKLNKILKSLNIKLSTWDKRFKGKKLARIIMKNFLTLSEPVMKLLHVHIPSPKESQERRKEVIYGKSNDAFSQNLIQMNPSGLFMVYVCHRMDNGRYPSKPFHKPLNQSLYHIGRIFSGQISRKDLPKKVRIVPVPKRRYLSTFKYKEFYQNQIVFHSSIKEMKRCVGRTIHTSIVMKCGSFCALKFGLIKRTHNYENEKEEYREFRRKKLDGEKMAGFWILEDGVECKFDALSHYQSEREALQEQKERKLDSFWMLEDYDDIFFNVSVLGLKIKTFRVLFLQ